MVESRQVHWVETKHVLRYLRYVGVMERGCKDIQTQIGQVVQLTGRALLVVVSAWDHQWFLGSIGNKLPWHSVQ
jgi:hypothetical protein